MQAYAVPVMAETAYRFSLYAALMRTTGATTSGSAPVSKRSRSVSLGSPRKDNVDHLNIINDLSCLGFFRSLGGLDVSDLRRTRLHDGG